MTKRCKQHPSARFQDLRPWWDRLRWQRIFDPEGQGALLPNPSAGIAGVAMALLGIANGEYVKRIVSQLK